MSKTTIEKATIQIRQAVPEDAGKLAEIYAPYVEKTAITFEYEVPSVTEFEKCGYKFGRWYNMVWMEKHIGAHGEHPSVRWKGE